MKCSDFILTGLVLFISTHTQIDAARRNKKRPVIGDSLNVGGLADSIMDALRPAIDNAASGFSAPTNRNNRGNPNGRQNNRVMPQEPQEVNLTVDQILEQYPWIENPEAVVDSTNQSNSTMTGNHGPIDTAADASPSNRIAANQANSVNEQRRKPKSDGRTRFNNPRYLRDRLNGLNRDNYDFKVSQGVKTSNGKYKVKLNQQWRNLPIYGTALVLEQEPDANLILESADGEFLSGVEDDIASETPTLSKDEALEFALLYNQDQGKPIQNPSTELFVDTIADTAVLAYIINYFVPGTPSPADPVTESPITSVPPTMSTTTMFPSRNSWRSARVKARERALRRRCRRVQRRGGWRRGCTTTPAPTSTTTTTTTNQPPTVVTDAPDLSTLMMSAIGAKRPWVLMKADTGEIYKSWDGLTSYIRPSRIAIRTGNPVYGIKEYNEYMYKDTTTNACYYQRPLGNRKFLRVNDKSTSNTANVYKFRCDEGNDENYDRTNDAASTRNSAFKWGSEAVSFLRKASSTRWKFDINIETHHAGIHAVWNGREVQLGDGDPRFFYPLTTPDTVTHEVTHAFTEYNSNLEYSKQSGAINEAYSDIAASAFLHDFFNYPDPQVYLIGRIGIRYDSAIRDLCNPRNPQLLLYNPNNLIINSALQYTITTDHHNASALYSKAFCELSKTAGWNIPEAFKVFTNANVIYWRPTETFNSGACGVKKAAYDLKNTAQAVIDVDNAFSTVDIRCDQDWTSLPPT